MPFITVIEISKSIQHAMKGGLASGGLKGANVTDGWRD
jgi:hypothetical protein